MAFYTLLGLVVLLVLSLVWMAGQHRLKTKRARFDNREQVPVDKLVRTSFAGDPDKLNAIIYWWERAASTLRIDARLIRKDDRFDGILSPVAGYPTEDEIEELGAIVQEIVPDSAKRLGDATLDTFGQYVLFLAENSSDSIPASNGP